VQLPLDDFALTNVVVAGKASLSRTWESDELLLAFLTSALYKSQALFPSKPE
jgi:hypothetical protein